MEVRNEEAERGGSHLVEGQKKNCHSGEKLGRKAEGHGTKQISKKEKQGIKPLFPQQPKKAQPPPPNPTPTW